MFRRTASRTLRAFACALARSSAAPRLLALCAAAAIATGCATRAKQPDPATLPPPAELAVDHFVGTPLSGPRGGDAPATAGPAPAAAIPGVRVTFVALADAPRGAAGLAPLGTRASLLSAASGDDPVMAAARLARDAQLAEGDAADRLLADARAGRLGAAADLATLSGALPPGVTARFAATDRAAADHDAPLGPRGVAVEVASAGAAATAGAPASTSTSAGSAAATSPTTAPAPMASTGPSAAPAARSVRLALRVTDMVEVSPPPATAPADPAAPPKRPSRSSRRSAPPPPPPPTELRQESVLLDRPLDAAGRDRTAVVLPFRFAGGLHRALLVHVEVSPGTGDPAHAEATRRALTDAARAAAAPAGRPSPRADLLAGAADALARAATPASRRAALLFLADRTAAPATGDVALVADDATLAQLAAAVAAARRPADGPAAQADPGWVVDRATLALLSERLSGGALAPELTAVLVRRAGEVARRPDALAELVKASTGAQDFDNRLQAENLIALEDSAPAARVRAYDYLQVRGKAPAAYDPLGPGRARRAALEKAFAAPAPPAPTAAATQPAPAPATR